MSKSNKKKITTIFEFKCPDCGEHSDTIKLISKEEFHQCMIISEDGTLIEGEAEETCGNQEFVETEFPCGHYGEQEPENYIVKVKKNE
jgi:hypothetical protein